MEIKCTYTHLLPIDQLIPNPRNPNRHGQQQLELLSKVLKVQGFRQAIVISKRSGFIIKGHGRLEAAKLAGFTEVPVDEQDYNTEAEEWADMIADNRIAELAELDNTTLKDLLQELDTGALDMDLTGFDQTSLEDLMSQFFKPEEGLTDDDEIPEEVEPRCKPGDLWQLGEHRLMCGDSTSEEMIGLLMNNELSEMCYTDPPYGVDYDGGSLKREKLKGDEHGTSIYTKVVPLISKFCDGACYTWYAGTKPVTLYNAVEECGQIHALIIWVKNNSTFNMNIHYKQKHEPCLYWKPKNKSLRWDGDNKQETIWNFDRELKNNFHPTQKPVDLACKAIGNHKAESVLDLFLGSGSTLIACEKLKRKCFGMELEPHYCDVIIKRWEDFTGKRAEKINV